MGVYGPHTQVKRLLEALIFGTCKKNIIMYSQMRFQLYQSHSLTVTGLKNGKKSKYWVSMGPFRDLNAAFKLKLQKKSVTY